jgi:hypothetical protein
MGRRALVMLVLVIVVIVASVGGVRWSSRASEVGSDIAPTPTVREGTVSVHASRGRLQVIEIRPGELRLEGVVIDERDAPVGGAKVTLGNARETVTEGDGSFYFDRLAAGEYQLIAETEHGYTESSLALVADTEPLTLKLRIGPQLTVRVIDAITKEPIGGATVATLDRTGITDDSGTVTLRAIDSGYEPFTVLAAGRAPVRMWVRSDAPTILERTVELGRAASVAGIVIDAAGTPVPNAAVSVYASGGGWSEEITADAGRRRAS